MFAFRIDEKNKLVHVEIAGIMSVSEVERFNEELLANASAARRLFGSFRFLVDARLCPVQPAETIGSFKLPHEVLKGGDDRYAVVLGSTLSKLQANRLSDDDRVRAFLSMDDAEAWLSGCAPSAGSEDESAPLKQA